MRLSEIHAAIEAGQEPGLPEDRAFATLVAIEHLARVEGLPVSALDFAAPRFGAKYTFQFSDLRGSWGGRAQYLAWRNLILNAQLLFAPGDVDADPWKSLDRAERLWRKNERAAFHGLYTLLPPGTHPREANDALLEKVHDAIPAEIVPRLRAGLNNFRQLFRNDLALRTGLLPDVCPSPLPGIRSHRQVARMSPEIETWRNGLSDSKIKRALDYLSRLAIAAGRLNGETDTLDDLRVALCDLPSPETVNVPSVAKTTLYQYEKHLRRGLGGPDPRKSPSEQAWADLWTAARTAGCETSCLWAISKPAAARGLFPAEVSETVALEILASHHHSSRSPCRRGCEQLDALRGKVPPDLLPPSPLGIRLHTPRPPREPKPVRPPDPVKIAWADLYARLRARGWTHKQTSALSYVRVRASTAGIAPGALSQDFIDTLERDAASAADRDRLRAAVSCISTLSSDEFAHLPDLKAIPYVLFTHGGPTKRAGAELEELMNFMNAAATTRCVFRMAVGVITDAIGRPDLSLKKLLESDMSGHDLGPHEPRRKTHTNKIRSLRAFLELPWTPAWRELQRVVTGTGLTALDNPVPKVLAWHPGTDPEGLTLDWAQRLDRELRSTLKNPPDGCADLARKLARHLAAFDALHEIPAVAESGLLPPRIGQLRDRVKTLQQDADAVALPDVVELIRHTKLQKSRGKNYKIFVASPGDIGERGYLEQPRRSFTADRATYMLALHQRVQPGDVLLSIKGAIGVVGLVPEDVPREGDAAIWTVGQSLVILRPKKSGGMDSLSLYEYLTNETVQALIQSLASASAIPILAIKDLHTFPVSIPSKQVMENMRAGFTARQALLDEAADIRRRIAAERAELWPHSQLARTG